MIAMQHLGRITTRGLVSLVIAYVLIVKVVIGAAATTVTLPEAGLDPVICLTDHAAAFAASEDGAPVQPDSHRCDDCSLQRIGGGLAPLPDPVVVAALEPASEPTSRPFPLVRRTAAPPREAWGPTRAQRGPPGLV